MLNPLIQALPLTCQRYLFVFIIILNLFRKSNGLPRKICCEALHESVESSAWYAAHCATHLQKREPACEYLHLLPGHGLVVYQHGSIKAHAAPLPRPQIIQDDLSSTLIAG